MYIPYWEYEMILRECENIAEEEKKSQEEEQGKYGNPSLNHIQHQSNQMMRGYQNRMPSIPSMPKIPTKI